jgi:4'-phosphopantetheinyl transferase EntD
LDSVRARLSLVRPLLPPGVAAAVRDPGGDLPAPLPEESVALSPRAVDKRRREFAAGRAAARDAMGQLGLDPAPVVAAEDRAPIWPDGLVGSISHCRDCAIAAVAQERDIRSLGIDVEQGTPLEARLLPSICSERERAWLRAGDQPLLLAKLVFSAKEAAYKCQYPLSRRLFGFDAMELDVDLERRRFTAVFTQDQGPFSRGYSIQGRFAIGAGVIITLALLTPEGGD